MRPVALLLLFASLAPAPEPARGFIQAVEFPYYAFPPQLWERELVWLKNLGIDTVAFRIPWNWHQVDADTIDLTGKTSPRRDLVGFIRLVKRAGLQAWIRPMPPVHAWLDSGHPSGLESDRRALRDWLSNLQDALEPFLASHGGPIAFAEAPADVFKCPEPPAPITVISARAPHALAQSRQVFAAGHGSLLWEEVEDQLPPVGWEASGGPIFHTGAVSVSGEERVPLMALRRDALLWRYWGAALPAMKPAPPVRIAGTKLPSTIVARQLLTPQGVSALSIINQSKTEFAGTFRAYDLPSKGHIALPQIRLAPNEALWLPVNIPLAGEEFCRDCAGFANHDHIVYATAELNTLEYENGILAMEFAAPRAGEVVLQLSQEPSGPLLAAGHPTSFDWDDRTHRVRLPIPEGTGAGDRVRIALAIQPPDVTAFFADAKRFTIGQQNSLETSYSSEAIAQRSRLLIPENFHTASEVKSPTEIDYKIDVPADSLHGEWTPLALEADGIMMTRARVQLLRPVSIRLREAVSLHYGSAAELAVMPALVPVEAQSGREVSVVLHNNSPDIRNFVVEAEGEGLEFSPRTEIAIGGNLERDVLVRLFPVSTMRGLAPWRLHVTGDAEAELPVNFVVMPRGRALAYSVDLDNDGQPEWVLENQHARAVFSSRDGGRWLEFVWKDSGRNVLPETGALVGKGPVDVQITDDGALEFHGDGWRRTAKLAPSAAALTLDQTTPLARETLQSEKTAGLVFTATRDSATHATYTIEREPRKVKE